MKRKYIILHALFLFCLFCMPLARAGYKDSNVALFLITMLPGIAGSLLIRCLIPFMITAGLTISALWRRREITSPFRGAIRPALALLYLLSLNFSQDFYKDQFFRDLKEGWNQKLILYHKSYKTYRGDIRPDFSDTAKKRRLDELFVEVQHAKYDTGILKDGVRYNFFEESVYVRPFWYTWQDIIRSRSIPLKKIGIELDTTTNGAQVRNERIGRLAFATGIVWFRLRCLTGAENTCLCQNTKGDVWYYGYHISLHFISTELLLFEAQYLLCFLLFLLCAGVVAYQIIRRMLREKNIKTRPE